MMKYAPRILYLLAAGLSLFLSGCASFDMIKPPPAQQQPISISFTHDELFSWKEFPLGAYRVPNSQTIISGHQKGGAIGGALFGPLGLLTQSAINSNREANATHDIRNILSFSLTQDSERISQNLISSEEFKNKFTLSQNSALPQLVVATAVVLTYTDETRVRPYVIIKASLGMPDRSEPVWATRYIASTGTPRPLAGPDSWTANNGEELKKSVSANLGKAIKFMLTDIATPFARDDARLVMVQGGFPFVPQRLQLVGRQLTEDENTLALLPRLGDGVAFSGVSILDKPSIIYRPAKSDDERFKIIEEPAPKSETP